MKMPLLEGTLKYYYPDYKNYYYLPLEDEAVHKSVGVYVDPACREKAKASNCCKRVSGYFLQAFGAPQIPLLKSSYESGDCYIQWLSLIHISKDGNRNHGVKKESLF